MPGILGISISQATPAANMDYQYLAKQGIRFFIIRAGVRNVADIEFAAHLQAIYEAEKALNFPLIRILSWGTDPAWAAEELVMSLNSAKLLTQEKNIEIQMIKHAIIDSPKSFHGMLGRLDQSYGAISGKLIDSQWVTVMSQVFIQQLTALFPDKPVYVQSSDDYIKAFSNATLGYSIFNWMPAYFSAPTEAHAEITTRNWADIEANIPANISANALNGKAVKLWRIAADTLPCGKGVDCRLGIWKWIGDVSNFYRTFNVAIPTGNPGDIPTPPPGPDNPPPTPGALTDSDKIDYTYRAIKNMREGTL